MFLSPERYMNFCTTFAFSRLFGTEENKVLLISFLNSLFQGKEKITDLTYLNTENWGTGVYNGKTIFVVACRTEEENNILVEIQETEQYFSMERSIFYSPLPIRDQEAKEGDWDYEIKAVYSIAIFFLDINRADSAYIHHEVKQLDSQTKGLCFDRLTYIYLELPKFKKEEDELVTLFDKWLYAINNLPTLMERPVVLHEPIFEKLFSAAEMAKLEPKEIFSYEYSLKVFRDNYSAALSAFNKGKREGRKEVAREIAIDMKQTGMPIEAIAQYSELSIEEIETL